MSNQFLRTLLKTQRKPLLSLAPSTTGALSKCLVQKSDYRNFITDKRIQSPTKNITVQREVDHHSSYANGWWDINGPIKSLHALNRIRVPFICDSLIARGNVSPNLIQTTNVLQNQKILEIGCGGGILTEDLARLGASVTALDLSEDLIRVAQEHLSKESNSNICERIEYKIESVESHAEGKQNVYDAIVISEVLEHIDDKVSFLTASVQCLKPGGSIIITTLNKTIRMWIYAVLLVEYVFKIIPIGTHHYGLMISPLDVQRILNTMDCDTLLVKGSIYQFWRNTWRWIKTDKFFYALHAVKAEK